MNRRERRLQERLGRREAAEQRASGYARAIVAQDAARKKVIDRLSQNGITPQDLEAEYNKGYQAGFLAAGEPVMQSCFAAICLALNDLHKFGQGRCAAVLNAVDQYMTEYLTSTEAIEAVYERMGLRLEFKEAFDRIQEI